MRREEGGKGWGGKGEWGEKGRVGGDEKGKGGGEGERRGEVGAEGGCELGESTLMPGTNELMRLSLIFCPINILQMTVQNIKQSFHTQQLESN